MREQSDALPWYEKSDSGSDLSSAAVLVHLLQALARTKVLRLSLRLVSTQSAYYPCGNSREKLASVFNTALLLSSRLFW